MILPRLFHRAPLVLASIAAMGLIQSVGSAQDWTKELFITDVGIVDDARATGNGPWSFGTLMGNLSGSSDLAIRRSFAKDWIETWTDDTNTVSGTGELCFNQLKADRMQTFIDQWIRVSNLGGELDLDQAPFRLLAIVNRVDLLKSGAGQISSAGEARFIFGAAGKTPQSPTEAVASQFFVIFEFGIPATSCGDLIDWASQWRALASHNTFDEPMRIELQAITDQFTGLQVGTDVNGTRLNQVRTDDFNLPGQSSPFWELREFNVVDTPGVGPGSLLNVTTKQEPRRKFVATAAGRVKLSMFLSDNQNDILAGQHVIPAIYDFQTGDGPETFLAGRAINDPNSIPSETGLPPSGIGTRWWAPLFDDTPNQPLIDSFTRAGFAQQTCSGCHQQETGTPFSMVSTREVGSPTTLAGFLTGIVDVPDPLQPTILTDFADIARRISVMDRIIAMNCVPGVPPVVEDIQAELGSRVH